MKRLFATIVFCLGGLACTAEDIAWEHDYNKARTRAATEGKLLFIDFATDW